ncbi:MAG: protein kinase [Elusimicrobia bacterium]|nr:protein kinase [Elusimicrobiota bacterium]
MTRTALGTLVFSVLLAIAGRSSHAEPTPAPSPTPSAFPEPLEPAPRGEAKPELSHAVLFTSLKPPKDSPRALADSFEGYNVSRSNAETRARRAPGATEAQVADAIRHDPAVQSALASAQQVVSNPSVKPLAREQIAAALNAVDKPEDAAKLSALTLSQEPDNRDALNNMAQARYSLGQYREAIEHATRAMKGDPNNEAAHTTRALAHYYAKDYVAAADDARRALSLNQNNEIAVATLRMAERKLNERPLKLDAAASEQARMILEEDRAAQESRNQVEAEAARRAAPAAGGAAVDPVNQRAAAKIAGSDQAGALADADKAIAADPRNAEAWYLRAQANNANGEYEKAAADASAALKIAPGHALAFGARAKAQHGLGRYQAAVDDANEAIRLDPTNAYAFATRARAFEKLGDFASMLSSFQQAARINRQFEPEYQKAAARHALPPAPSENKPAPREESSRPLWLKMLSMLLGGGLIAIGFFHIATAQWNKKLTTAIRQLEEARASITPPSLDVGTLTPHFQIVRALGRGGMGIVYEAIDKGLNRRVALKKMRDEIRIDPKERERFLQEARTVAGLHHPNIVDIHAIVEEGGELCLVFEHVAGRTVEQMLEQKKKLSLQETRVIMRGVCHALEYAHKRGVIHRDLKPSNVMLTDEQEVKVMDFGIARHAKDALSRMTVTNTVAGTPPYMAPEADQGVVRAETDIYALGACLYEMLTGERPFANNATNSVKLAMGYPKPTRVRKDLPAAVDALIDAALQPDPEKRIPNATKFLAQLEAAFSVPA